MELEQLKGIGKVRLEALRAAGINSLRDLLLYFPVRYEDYTQTVSCAEAQTGDSCLIEGVIHTQPKSSYFRGLAKVTVSIEDATGTMPLVWFNQPWIINQLQTGMPIRVFGHIGDKNNHRVMQNPRIIREQTIQPIYRGGYGIPPKIFHDLIRQALGCVDDCCPETLPKRLRMEHSLCELNFALRQIHYPDSMENLQIAQRRVAFETLLLYQTAVQDRLAEKTAADAIPQSSALQKEFWNAVPFQPTGAQQRVFKEICSDMEKPESMSRLVQGDVGCGKTIIAFGTIFAIARNGGQTAMMAPTQILARQHYESARKILQPIGVRCGLLVGSLKSAERRQAKEKLKAGKWQAVFGTHALISEDIEYHSLQLAITDEQHRFGVNQRSMLQSKGALDGKMPHVLVMSATPIPRTLSLILYGDLNVSVVDELPPGRKPVVTRIVPETKRTDMYRFIRNEILKGHQSYVVCPLVEDSEDEITGSDDPKSAEAMYKELKKKFPDLRILLTWGGQKAEEKEKVLRCFSQGKADILVSTTVIEVGVNVPNATIMVVENAERFGLSQLHQLRGRVGRGSQESWCFLVAEPNEKLSVLVKSQDGFDIAQKDLELRGPGELMGTRQSGAGMQDILAMGNTKMIEETAACLRKLKTETCLQNQYFQILGEARKRYSGKIARN